MLGARLFREDQFSVQTSDVSLFARKNFKRLQKKYISSQPVKKNLPSRRFLIPPFKMINRYKVSRFTYVSFNLELAKPGNVVEDGEGDRSREKQPFGAKLSGMENFIICNPEGTNTWNSLGLESLDVVHLIKNITVQHRYF